MAVMVLEPLLLYMFFVGGAQNTTEHHNSFLFPLHPLDNFALSRINASYRTT